MDVSSQFVRCLLHNFTEQFQYLRPYTETIASKRWLESGGGQESQFHTLFFMQAAVIASMDG